MTKDQTDLSHPQTLARSTSTRDGEPLKSCVSRCQSMEGRLACLFFFLAIVHDDEVAGVNRVMFGPDKQRNRRLVIAVRCCLSGPNIILERLLVPRH